MLVSFLRYVALSIVLCSWVATARAADPPADADDTQMRADAKAHLGRAKLSLEDAIAIAIKKHPGGIAIQAGFEVENDDYDYIVEIAVGARQFELEIDAMSGKIESDEAEDAADSKPEEAEAAAIKSKVSMAQAIAAARAGVAGSRAFLAQPYIAGGKLAYGIDLLAGADFYQVQVDGSSAKVIAKKKVD